MAEYQPLVSVIMPSYNSARFIATSIESVREQTFKDWELIITDDCSKDDTCMIVEKFTAQDSRIKLFKLEENSGAAVARNNSIKQAKGQYIAFLDSDDIWLPEKLEKQLAFMKTFGIGFSFTAYRTFVDGLSRRNVIHVPKSITYEKYLRNTIIGCLTVIIDRRIVGDFSMPLLRKNQDMATWLDILRKGHIGYGLDIVLGEYRIVDGSISHNKLKAAKSVWVVYRSVENLSIGKSLFCFCGYIWNAVKKKISN